MDLPEPSPSPQFLVLTASLADCVQGKDMASTQKCLAEAFQRMAQNGKTGMSRMLARMTLAGLPRGGGNGDDIRMTILNIMRENGIKCAPPPSKHMAERSVLASAPPQTPSASFLSRLPA